MSMRLEEIKKSEIIKESVQINNRTNFSFPSKVSLFTSVKFYGKHMKID